LKRCTGKLIIVLHKSTKKLFS